MTAVTSPAHGARLPAELTSTQIDAMRTVLCERRAVSVRRLERGDIDLIAERNPDGFDEALRRLSDDSAREELGEIDAALERMSVGVFGKCEHCAGPIPFERLETIPHTRFCVSCAQLDLPPLPRSAS